MKQSLAAALLAATAVVLFGPSLTCAADAPRTFKECFASSAPYVGGAPSVGPTPPEKLTQVPVGWTVVGGGMVPNNTTRPR